MEFFQLLNYSWDVNGRMMAYWQFYLGVVLAACGWLVQMKSKIPLVAAMVVTAVISYYFATTYLTIRGFYYRNHEINEEIKSLVDAQNIKNADLVKRLKTNHALWTWGNLRVQMLVINFFVILFLWYRSEPVDRWLARRKSRHRTKMNTRARLMNHGRVARRFIPMSLRTSRFQRSGSQMHSSRLINAKLNESKTRMQEAQSDLTDD